MNPDLRKAAKMILKKDYFKLINNSNFGKNMENFGKHNLVATEKRANYLVSGPTYYKDFQRNFIDYRTGKTQTLINKPVYLGLKYYI